jgi:hypothetical protein
MLSYDLEQPFLSRRLGTPSCLQQFTYRAVMRRVATSLERSILRPTLNALYLIGSDYARGTVVDLFLDHAEAARRHGGDKQARIDAVSLDIGRRLLSQLGAMHPRDAYSPASLIDLVAGGSRDEDEAGGKGRHLAATPCVDPDRSWD